MNQEQITERLKEASKGKIYRGSLSTYAAQSIVSGRSNYPVSNLITYCKDLGLELVMKDLTTEDCFSPDSVLEVHKVLNLLMERYEIDSKIVYQKTSVHYTAPKSFAVDEFDKMKSNQNGGKYAAPLSINTFLAVCEVIHCDLSFIN